MTLLKPRREATFALVAVRDFLARFAGGGSSVVSVASSDADDSDVNRNLKA